MELNPSKKPRSEMGTHLIFSSINYRLSHSRLDLDFKNKRRALIDQLKNDTLFQPSGMIVPIS